MKVTGLLGGMLERMSTDWTSGERVFAPPSGTVDPDWLVPALLERQPHSTPKEASGALRAAWARHRGEQTDGAEALSPLDETADALVAAAVKDFRA